MLRLEPMSEEDFEASRARGIDRHAADQVRRGLWTKREALAASRDEFAQLLPEGRETPRYRFCNLVDDADGSRVGETWYLVRTQGGTTQLWLDWIWIGPQFRRRGHATEALRLLEEEASHLGADRIGLHVVADNPAAIALYTKLGYTITNLRMAKLLQAPP